MSCTSCFHYEENDKKTPKMRLGTITPFLICLYLIYSEYVQQWLIPKMSEGSPCNWIWDAIFWCDVSQWKWLWCCLYFLPKPRKKFTKLYGLFCENLSIEHIFCITYVMSSPRRDYRAYTARIAVCLLTLLCTLYEQ